MYMFVCVCVYGEGAYIGWIRQCFGWTKTIFLLKTTTQQQNDKENKRKINFCKESGEKNNN